MLRLLCIAMLATGCLTRYDDIQIERQSSIELAPHSHVQLHAYGLRPDGTREDITDLVRWSTTDREIATVNETGTLEWQAAGHARVRIVLYNLGATVALTAADSAPRTNEIVSASAISQN